MRRDARKSSSSSSSQRNAPSSYLVYLFLISVGFILCVPYLVPWLGMFQRPTKKVEANIETKPTTLQGNSLLSTPQSLSSSSLQRSYLTDVKYDGLESLIVDIQRAVQLERERILKLENDVRILELSERYLKERVQKVEDRSAESPKTGYNSIDLLSQSIDGTANNLGNVDTMIQNALRTVQADKERINALYMEIGMLKSSESNLVERVKILEQAVSTLMPPSNGLDGVRSQKFVTN